MKILNNYKHIRLIFLPLFVQNFYNKEVNNNSEMFGKAKCKLCGDNVRFVLRHLKENIRKH